MAEPKSCLGNERDFPEGGELDSNAQAYAIVDFIKKDNMQLNWTTKAGFRYADQFLNTHSGPS